MSRRDGGGGAVPDSWPTRLLPRAAIAVAVAIALSLLAHILRQHTSVPQLAAEGFNALVALALGLYLANLLEQAVHTSKRQDVRRAATIRLILRLLLYVAILVAVLSSFGVNLGSLAFGGAFLSVIIGLAGQSVFANLLAGVNLVLWHPFDVGERVSMVSTAFAMMPATFPHEAEPASYSGTITDINLMYTHLLCDDGLTLQIPNGLVGAAMIRNHSRTQARRLRVRLEVPFDREPGAELSALAQFLHDRLGRADGVVGPVHLSVADVGLQTYAVALEFDALPVDAERARALVLQALAKFRHGEMQEAGS